MSTPHHSPVLHSCPTWCRVDHAALEPHADTTVTHVSGRLIVRDTLLWLTQKIDSHTGQPAEPYVQLGLTAYTVHEAEVLIAAITQLTDTARLAPTPTATFSAMRPPGVVPQPAATPGD